MIANVSLGDHRIVGLATDIEVLDGLSQAIGPRMTADDQRIPGAK